MMARLGKVSSFYALCRGSDSMARSFVNAWQASMKIHEVMADNRIKFATRLNEMSEELANLAKEVDKNRKAVSAWFGRLLGAPAHGKARPWRVRPRTWPHVMSARFKKRKP